MKRIKKKLPTFRQLAAEVLAITKTNYKPIFGVTFVYALLYFVLVLGLNITYSYDAIDASVKEALGQNTNLIAEKSIIIANLFGGGASANQSDATILIQFLLFIVASMAIIWVLRTTSATAPKTVRIRSAFYDGVERVVPFSLVFLVLLACFVPASVGLSIFSIAQQAGSAGEVFVASVVAGVLLFISFYLISMWIFALYVASLPSSTPVLALRSAQKLTKTKRLWVLRQCTIGALLLFFVAFLAMLPIVLFVPIIAIVAAFSISFLLFGLFHVFLFTMYRSLLDD